MTGIRAWRREIGVTSLIALAFGLGSYRVLGELSAFIVVDVALGGAGLLVAIALELTRLGEAGRPGLRLPTADALLSAVATIWFAVLLQQASAALDLRFDWTFEGQFELAPATRAALTNVPKPLQLSLYWSEGDPRRRTTELLLDQMARAADGVEVRSLDLDANPEDEDRFGIGSSNSVVVRSGSDWLLVERPTEGGLWEAISLLSQPFDRIVYSTVGIGDGDLERSDDVGYSGLRAALETEGYVVRPLPLALLDRIPADADLVLSITPRRALPQASLDALVRYVEGGGRLIAFVDPGITSGLDRVLEHFGFRSPDRMVIDPTIAATEGEAPGVSVVAHSYAEHPVTRGLAKNTMTFFKRARPFELFKAEPQDEIRPLVYSSRESWLLDAPGQLGRGEAPERPEQATTTFHPIAAAARLPRGEHTGRIVAFGDSDFASNHYLRALYNLDLVMNAVHWAAERTPEITQRPKLGGRALIQFPVPLQSSLQALYGIGLAVPQLLLMAAALIWLRRRGA